MAERFTNRFLGEHSRVHYHDKSVNLLLPYFAQSRIVFWDSRCGKFCRLRVSCGKYHCWFGGSTTAFHHPSSDRGFAGGWINSSIRRCSSAIRVPGHSGGKVRSQSLFERHWLVSSLVHHRLGN